METTPADHVELTIISTGYKTQQVPPASSDVKFLMLGELQMLVGGTPVAPGPPKQQALLALLLLRRNRPVPMSRIISGIWGSMPPATARAQVHAHVAGLRGLLKASGAGRDLLTTSPAGYVLRPPPDSVDLDVFDNRVASARQLLDGGRPDAAIATLRQALDLWRGTGLDGLRAAFTAETAEQLGHRRLAAFELLADAHQAARRDAELIPELDELSAAHPLHEGVRHRLMLALHRNGRTADALRVYREGWHVTTRELGIEPGARLRELETAILQGEQPARPTGAAGGAAAQVGCQLPADVPAFVGRVLERDRTLSRLGAPCERPAVVVVSGPPGAGKTAFAVHVGRAARAYYPDGQLFLRLRGSSDSPLPVADAVAILLRGLGFAGAAVPEQQAERLALYRAVLGERRVLIVLDDVGGAADVRELLPGSPGSALLMTSRSALAGIDGDRVRLGPLSAVEAVTLLASTAGADRVAADPESAARIVRRCGCLPLAVRIAGARLTGNSQRSLAELNAALRDQRRRLDELASEDLEVRTVLASADQCLSAPAREAYQLLSTLLPAYDLAGWTVAAVLDASTSYAERIVDELAGMNVLLPAGGDRYRLHDLVRLYGKERALVDLPAGRRQAAAERLRGAYLDLAERAEQEFGGGFVGPGSPRPAAWSLPESLARRLVADPVAWFEAERLPLAAMVRRAARSGATGAAARLAAPLAVFYESRAYFDDWRATHEQVLEAARQARDHVAAMTMLRNLGELHTIQDRYALAITCFEEALAHARRMRDFRYAAAALSGLGHLHRLTGDNPRAVICFAQAERLCAHLRNVPGQVYAMYGIGVVHLQHRRWAQARTQFTTCLRLSRGAGYLPGEAQALRCLGKADQGDGRHAGAERHFRKAEEAGKRLGDRLVEAYAVQWLGFLRIRLGDPAEGTRLLHRCLSVYRDCGQRFGQAMALAGLADAATATGQTGTARHYLIQALRIWERIGSPYWVERARSALTALDGPGPHEPAFT
ncbi:BTAD domain-containing putative transcriptional regulator [Nonomuraea sp. NPDC050404]|uniref:AfsR/SARP family transcriptional regulator n=1 Tax=Nonomuraea sp. NPDC050404 TaxID=3155783 RepID=UPI00340C00FF